jgi:hypothetical protein
MANGLWSDRPSLPELYAVGHKLCVDALKNSARSPNRPISRPFVVEQEIKWASTMLRPGASLPIGWVSENGMYERHPRVHELRRRVGLRSPHYLGTFLPRYFVRAVLMPAMGESR